MPEQRHGPQFETPPLGEPLELECPHCGTTDSYSVGRVFLDKQNINLKNPWASWTPGFSCTGCIRCRKCEGIGPWKLTQNAELSLRQADEEARLQPNKRRLIYGVMALEGGLVFQTGSLAAEHIKRLIASSPQNMPLWRRLGNVYVSAEEFQLALEAFQEAVRLNDEDLEAVQSLGFALWDLDRYEEALPWMQRTLAVARLPQAKKDQRWIMLVGGAFLLLLKYGRKTGRYDGLIPNEIAPPGADLSKVNWRAYDQEGGGNAIELALWWREGRGLPPPPQKKNSTSTRSLLQPQPQPTRNDPQRPPVGRNDLCPCGSGKKFKKCCG